MNPVWPSWQEVATKPALTSNLFTWEAVGNCFKIDQHFCYLKKKTQTHQPFSKNTFGTARVLSKRYKRPLCLCFSAMVCWLLFFLNGGEEKKHYVKSLISTQSGCSYHKTHTLCHFKTQMGSRSNILQITSSFLFPL